MLSRRAELWVQVHEKLMSFFDALHPQFRAVCCHQLLFFALVFLLPRRTSPKRRKCSQFSAYNRSRETTNSSAKWCSRNITPYFTNLLLIKCMEAERKNSLSDLMTFNWIKLFFFMRLLVENCFEKMALLRDNHQTTIEQWPQALHCSGIQG